jgi:HAD superfamily hydrolase (TIGR01509 family)
VGVAATLSEAPAAQPAAIAAATTPATAAVAPVHLVRRSGGPLPGAVRRPRVRTAPTLPPGRRPPAAPPRATRLHGGTATGHGRGVTVAALVFDFDGLILDTEVPEFVTVREVFRAHGLDLALADWQQIIGRADHRHWLDWLEDELGEPLADRERVRVQRQARHHAMIAEMEVLPGVVALLDEAATRGVPVAVASSSSASWVEGHLETYGLASRVSLVRCRDHVARAKPWPDLFTAAVEGLGVDPAASVALEDSANGAAAAKAAGLFCVVAPNDITRGQDHSHADLVVASLAEVTLDLLDARLSGV